MKVSLLTEYKERSLCDGVNGVRVCAVAGETRNQGACRQTYMCL